MSSHVAFPILGRCRSALGVAVLAAVTACHAAAGPATVTSSRHGEILWDTWGIPHIYGDSLADVAYGLGRAQMQSHGDLLLKLYGQARGRAAEYWGDDALALDRWVHTMSIPQRAAEWYEAQEPGERAVIDGFVAGLNSYAAEHPERISAAMRVVLPIQGSDVLAHLQRVVHFTFVSSPIDAMADVERWSHAGSNAWAIAPSRSASRHALLLANPHLPWGDLFTLYEVQLVAPGLDVYGVTFVGFPVVAIGFNRELAWTHTVNTFDGADLYELELADGGYSLDGAVRPFTTRQDTVRIRQPDGSLRDEQLTVQASVHGPVVGVRNGRALALRVAGLDAPHLLGQYLQMARASTLGEFEAAVARLQLPMFNVIYADRAGHVLEVFNARVPRRARGDAAFWAGIVPGVSSSLLWNDTLRYAELPRTVDPPSGWLQNANDPPWSMTFPGALDPARFPAYLSPPGMAQYRSQRSIELIESDDRMTLDKLVAYKFSTRMALADRLLDDLIPAARRGGALARQAADVLEAWDRTADARSRGSVLFVAWANEYLGEDTFTSPGLATPWTAGSPVTTPAGLADPARAVAALEAAARKVTGAYHALDVPWGEVHRIHHADVDRPASGATDQFGCFDAAWYTPGPDGTFTLEGGDTFIAAVELGATVTARAALGYGNASQAGSSHRADQLPLLENKQLRDVWLTRAAVEQHLERREPIGTH